MRRTIAILMVLIAATTMVSAQTNSVSSVNVVGFHTVGINGSTTDDAYSLITAPMTKVPVVRGVISNNTATTITDGSATWSTDQFAAGAAGQEASGTSTFYIEITDNSLFEGRHFYIDSNTANTLTLSAAMSDVGVDELQGASYKIIPANRVRDIFGEPGGNVVLASGSSDANADVIYSWIPGDYFNAKWSSPIYYQTGGFPFANNNHWVQSGGVVDDKVIDRDEGLLVLRRAGVGATNFVAMGEVSANTQAVVVASGYQVLNGMVPVDTAIGNTSLTDVMASGSSDANADVIYGWVSGDYLNAKWTPPVYYQTGGFPFANNNHWVQSGGVVDDSFILEAGKGYLILLRNATTNVWGIQSAVEIK